MMRDIKFRAWEKELKEIIPVSNINFERELINTEGAWRMFHEIELMQFTGLTDKNGVDIYEGDIVKYTSKEQTGTRGNYKASYSIYSDVEILGLVKFEQLQYHVTSSQFTSYESYFFADSKNRGSRTVKYNLSKPMSVKTEYEVIGNIYENAHLLNETEG